jgi:hypothetical protein
MNHTSHSGVANPTPLQVQSPNSFPNYDMRKRIKTTLHTSTRIRNDLQFLKIHEILRLQVDLEMAALTDSKDEDKDDLRFFQKLRQTTIPTPQSIADQLIIPLVVSGFLKT